ncbi:unnamed protein product [Eruca vesicaria subsp. sativa]|uniref:C2 domain-containing protein n=1 Tax=Eruca vesicaria subsp. sativa TaxID=29727 RepID=A0ABC8KM14_ERUVS|nr:unnamed protein product [Eruca vesicaria subsp. sativa]
MGVCRVLLSDLKTGLCSSALEVRLLRFLEARILGTQKLQTTAVNSNLNPVWNQELMLSVPDSYGPVKLGYDYNTFSADDIMGETQLDIQLLITFAMAYGDAEIFGDVQLKTASLTLLMGKCSRRFRSSSFRMQSLEY